MLDRPVESSGELVYRPPARLEKRTLKPKAESLVLDGDVLVVERGKQKYTLQLQQYPEIAAIVGSIRNTLAGDLAALEQQYRVDLQGSPERWSLTLLPSDPRIAAIVAAHPDLGSARRVAPDRNAAGRRRPLGDDDPPRASAMKTARQGGCRALGRAAGWSASSIISSRELHRRPFGVPAARADRRAAGPRRPVEGRARSRA